MRFHPSLVHVVCAQGSSITPIVVRRDPEHLESLLRELDLDDGLVAKLRKSQHQRHLQRRNYHAERRVHIGRVRRTLTRICRKKLIERLVRNSYQPLSLSLTIVIIQIMS